MKIVTDEMGVVWTVSARDPAKQYVNKLHSRGFDIVVLSRHTLMTGLLPDQPPPCSDYIRNVRLKDCLLVLSDKHLEVID